MPDISTELFRILNAPSEHSFRSPSTAPRWLRCLRAPYLEALVNDEPSPEALQGTLAHAVANTMFRYPDNTAFDALLGFEWRGQVVDQEMLGHCLRYRDAALNIEDGPTAAFFEGEVEIGQGISGTVDFSCATAQTLYVRDFKYGRVYVDPEDNPQLKLYAIGALNMHREHGFSDVVLSIDQPRAYGAVVKEWHTTPAALRWWFDFEVGDLPPEDLPRDQWPDARPGEIQCANCKAAKAGICEAVECDAAELSVAVKVEKPSQALISKPVAEMTAEELGVLLSFEAGYDAWKKGVDAQLKKVKARALEILQNGGAVPGQKLVNGRSSREWKNEEEFILFCGRKGVSPLAQAKVMSPAQAEKEFDYADLAPMIETTVPLAIASVDSKSREVVVL